MLPPRWLIRRKLRATVPAGTSREALTALACITRLAIEDRGAEIIAVGAACDLSTMASQAVTAASSQDSLAMTQVHLPPAPHAGDAAAHTVGPSAGEIPPA